MARPGVQYVTKSTLKIQYEFDLHCVMCLVIRGKYITSLSLSLSQRVTYD